MATSTASLSFSYVDAPEVLSLGATMSTVAIVVVATRFYLRRIQKSRVAADDWLILAALMTVVGMGACLIAGAESKVMGYPTPLPPSLSPEQLEIYVEPAVRKIQQIEFPFEILMLIGYALIKLSIIYFLRRLFVVGKTGHFNIITLSMVTIVVLWLITFLGLFIFGCKSHVDYHWGNLAQISSSCYHPFRQELGMAFSDLILDILIFILPFPMIWKLHMSTSQKFAVSGVFLIALVAILASITRLVIYVQILTNGDKAKLDENLTITVALYWAYIEAGLALLAACLPSLSTLFARASIASIIRSVRSVLSLHSISSQNPRRSQQNPRAGPRQHAPYKNLADERSTASNTCMAHNDENGVDSFAMSGLEAGDIMENVGEGEIHAKNEMMQESAMKAAEG